MTKPGARSRKRKKKGTPDKGIAEDGIRLKKPRREAEIPVGDEDY